jgi:lambda family phage tail tape measure protein
MATTNERVDIQINGNQALASLRSIERSVDLLANGFREFMTGVAEGMSGALQETTKFKAGVDNVKKSVDGLGASADKANLGKKIGAQAAEANKSIKGLDVNIGGLGKQLLGIESIIGGLAFTQLARGVYQYAQETKGQSRESAVAALAMDSLASNMNNFRQAMLQLLEPLNQNIKQLNISVDGYKKLLDILVQIGTFIAGGFIARGLGVLVAAAANAAGKMSRLFGGVGNYGRGVLGSIEKIANRLRNVFDPSRVEILQKRTSQMVNADASGGAFSGAIKSLTRYIELNKIWQQISFTVGGALALIATNLNNITNALDSQSSKLPSYIGYWKTLIDILKFKINPAKNLEEQLAQLDPRQGRGFGGDSDSAKLRADAEKKRIEDLLNAKQAMDEFVLSQRRQNQNTIEQLRLQNRLFGANEDYAEIQRTLLQQEQNRRATIQDLQDKIAKGGSPELMQVYRDQIAAYNKIQIAADATAIAEIKALQKKRAEQAALNRAMEYSIQLFNQQRSRSEAVTGALMGIAGRSGDMAFERSLLGKGGFERDLLSKRRELEAYRNELIKSVTEAFTIDGEIADMRGYEDAIKRINDGVDALKRNIDNLTAANRRFGTGWSEAFENYKDRATDAAATARDVFNTMTNSIETAIDNMIENGKFKWSEFRNNIVKELLKIYAKNALRNLIGGMDGVVALIGDKIKGAFSISGNVLAPDMDAAKAIFGNFFNWAGSMFNKLFDMIGDNLSDVGNMLMSVVRQLSSMGSGSGNFLATIGSWFAGFFAKGGYIPPGKAGIVGEAGPELVSGPANVTPMNQLGGGQVVNNYYYSISAVDAKSVAQLFSENRRTMLGAVEQARKEMPIRGGRMGFA